MKLLKPPEAGKGVLIMAVWLDPLVVCVGGYRRNCLDFAFDSSAKLADAALRWAHVIDDLDHDARAERTTTEDGRCGTGHTQRGVSTPDDEILAPRRNVTQRNVITRNRRNVNIT